MLGVNRDERYARPARPPRLTEGPPRIIAPEDVDAGGTWVGATDDGLVAAIANRQDAPSGPRSRGWLVRMALESGTADAARDRVRAALETGEYAGCYLLVADEITAHVVEWDGEVRTRSLAPGLHVLVNAGLDDPSKARRVRDRMHEAPPDDRSAWRTRLQTLMTDHDLGVCVHGDGVGTRSSSIVTVTPDRIAYEFADGHPCRTPYERIHEGQR